MARWLDKIPYIFGNYSFSSMHLSVCLCTPYYTKGAQSTMHELERPSIHIYIYIHSSIWTVEEKKRRHNKSSRFRQVVRSCNEVAKKLYPPRAYGRRTDRDAKAIMVNNFTARVTLRTPPPRRSNVSTRYCGSSSSC